MNVAKSNYLIEISEVEITASIELTAPLFMLMILVSAMTTVSTQKIRGSCGNNILSIVLRPISWEWIANRCTLLLSEFIIICQNTDLIRDRSILFD